MTHPYFHRLWHLAIPPAFIERRHSFRSWPLLTWYINLYRGIPARSAKALKHKRSPLAVVTKMVARLLSCCSACVAHLQFPFEYPRSGFLRSSVVPFGRSPMSAKKFSNFSHRLQTLIPRPPYKLYLAAFGSLHRAHIERQEAYSLLNRTLSAARSCGTKFLSNFSRILNGSYTKHPQLRDCPCVNVYAITSRSVPQSHLHRHLTALLGLFAARSMTRKRPNLWPERSLSGIGMGSVYQGWANT